MKLPFILCLWLSCLAAHRPANAQAATTVGQQAAPSQAYFQVAGDLARLLQRATVLPGVKALALLRREGPALQARARQVKPAYERWLQTLSPTAIKEEEKRMASSAWGKYFLHEEENMKPTPLGVKTGRNRAIAEQVYKLMTVFDGI